MAVPKGLHVRGRALWKALGRRLDTAEGALALEACRAVDRLERLDGLLSGRHEWFELTEQVEGSGVATVIVDKALAEARQQQNNLRQMLITLAASAPVAAPAEPPAEPPAEASASSVDEFTQRRRGRGA